MHCRFFNKVSLEQNGCHSADDIDGNVENVEQNYTELCSGRYNGQYQQAPTDEGPYLSGILHGYRKPSNIGRTLVGNEIVDHSDVVGASPIGAAPTTSSFST